jgi:molybdopterin molybdotransferase
MEDFFDVKSVSDARETLVSEWLRHSLLLQKAPAEEVELCESLGRILALDVTSQEDVPAYPRSTVDGYAVRSKDTFGASEHLPAILNIAEDIQMGSLPQVGLSAGQASRIPTGGALPDGADACVMVEHTELLDRDTVLVQRPSFPGENVVQRGEDVARGETVICAGTALRPFDIGALAAVGVTSAKVLRKPRVAIISTGDEIIEPSSTPQPGEMRDVNTYSLCAAVSQAKAIPVVLGISRDDYGSLRTLVERGLAEADMVIVSGGSSVGTRDMTVNVFRDLGPPGVLVHGVAVKPGKPMIIGICKGKPVFGLPGHPVSALTAFDLFVRFAMNVIVSMPRWAKKAVADGADPPSNPVERAIAAANALSAAQEIWTEAYLSRNVSSAPGRLDFVRVRLCERDGKKVAEPVLGKSGLISVLSGADGEIVVPFDSEGLIGGTLVRVRLFPGRA